MGGICVQVRLEIGTMAYTTFEEMIYKTRLQRFYQSLPLAVTYVARDLRAPTGNPKEALGWFYGPEREIAAVVLGLGYSSLITDLTDYSRRTAFSSHHH